MNLIDEMVQEHKELRRRIEKGEDLGDSDKATVLKGSIESYGVPLTLEALEACTVGIIKQCKNQVLIALAETMVEEESDDES